MNIIQNPDSKNYNLIQQLKHLNKQRNENAKYDNYVVGFGENFANKCKNKFTPFILLLLLLFLYLLFR